MASFFCGSREHLAYTRCITTSSRKWLINSSLFWGRTNVSQLCWRAHNTAFIHCAVLLSFFLYFLPWIFIGLGAMIARDAIFFSVLCIMHNGSLGEWPQRWEPPVDSRCVFFYFDSSRCDWWWTFPSGGNHRRCTVKNLWGYSRIQCGFVFICSFVKYIKKSLIVRRVAFFWVLFTVISEWSNISYLMCSFEILMVRAASFIFLSRDQNVD